ncbi:uncharacterized protein I303_104137 [Kwoniella dejecticola CBS 10117]|uniref:Asp/Glu/hydantoin racemase n=1 Tax=Kwoniella dejecticola CBS 10117 TaxID=1296121 RepID=A0A1A6A661_9TREE|nr:uncharacterized protein I303_04884 [Kwoniella dejecticola CBS 10117]OBR85548.1 hypothetical protein I303_04884 [Kwoniella dejecticola CBS 10117]
MSIHASTSILVVNPNSSSSITKAIERSLTPHIPQGTTVDFFNPSTGPAGISDQATAQSSCQACMDELPNILHRYNGVLVACFSNHPLIAALKSYATEKDIKLSVLGIYHAGVATALLRTTGRFGIIATGSGIKTNLIEATAKFLGSADTDRFVGPITTGISVVDLQEGDQVVVEERMKVTTKILVGLGAEVIVLGCGGMCGMEPWIIESAAEEGKQVQVVDGARMGLQMIVALIHGQ